MLLSNEFLTVRTLTVLRCLNVTTVEQLKALTLPTIGTRVFFSPLAMIKIFYTTKVDTEIKDFLTQLK
jgi:hypothetical protein